MNETINTSTSLIGLIATQVQSIMTKYNNCCKDIRDCDTVSDWIPEICACEDLTLTEKNTLEFYRQLLGLIEQDPFAVDIKIHYGACVDRNGKNACVKPIGD